MAQPVRARRPAARQVEVRVANRRSGAGAAVQARRPRAPVAPARGRREGAARGKLTASRRAPCASSMRGQSERSSSTPVEDLVRVDARGERLVGEHDAVTQHVRARGSRHVDRQHVVTPAQQRERARPAWTRFDRPRAGLAPNSNPALLGGLARRRHQRDGVLHHPPVDVDRRRRVLMGGEHRRAEDLARLGAAVERALDPPRPSSRRLGGSRRRA